MFSPVFTICRNKAILAIKELRKYDKTIQAYVKYPAKLMVKKAHKHDIAFLQNIKH